MPQTKTIIDTGTERNVLIDENGSHHAECYVQLDGSFEFLRWFEDSWVVGLSDDGKTGRY